jgi:transcriptional regulator with XRE-family HTH domain
MRAVRHRLRLRQIDVANRAHVSASTISRIERGFIEPLAIGTLVRVADTLEVRLDLQARWRGGDLDRMLRSGHAAMHETVARGFNRYPAWEAVPEVTFAIGRERGAIDLLAFHPARRVLLVVELKTDLVDLHELLSAIDRYRRLARSIGQARGWRAETVACWVAIRDSRTNRRRVAAHGTVLKRLLPANGFALRRWLHDPVGPMAALSFLPDVHARTVGRAGTRRVRVVPTVLSVGTPAQAGSIPKHPPNCPPTRI